MAEYTEDDVARLAELVGDAGTSLARSFRHFLARHLLDQGVTLPPPPPPTLAEAVAAYREATTPPGGLGVICGDSQGRVAAARKAMYEALDREAQEDDRG